MCIWNRLNPRKSPFIYRYISVYLSTYLGSIQSLLSNYNLHIYILGFSLSTYRCMYLLLIYVVVIYLCIYYLSIIYVFTYSCINIHICISIFAGQQAFAWVPSSAIMRCMALWHWRAFMTTGKSKAIEVPLGELYGRFSNHKVSLSYVIQVTDDSNKALATGFM